MLCETMNRHSSKEDGGTGITRRGFLAVIGASVTSGCGGRGPPVGPVGGGRTEDNDTTTVETETPETTEQAGRALYEDVEALPVNHNGVKLCYRETGTVFGAYDAVQVRNALGDRADGLRPIDGTYNLDIRYANVDGRGSPEYFLQLTGSGEGYINLRRREVQDLMELDFDAIYADCVSR